MDIYLSIFGLLSSKKKALWTISFHLKNALPGSRLHNKLQNYDVKSYNNMILDSKY